MSILFINNSNISSSEKCVQETFSFLPAELERLILRLAFSTLQNVSNPRKGFDHPETETSSELYLKIKSIKNLSINDDPALSENIVEIEKILVGRVSNVIKNIPITNAHRVGFFSGELDTNKLILHKEMVEKIIEQNINQTAEEKIIALCLATNETDMFFPGGVISYYKRSVLSETTQDVVDLLFSLNIEHSIKNRILINAITHPSRIKDQRELSESIAKRVLELGANPNHLYEGANLIYPYKGTLRSFPLHLCHSPVIAKLLLDYRAHVESQDAQGNTPLHRAAQLAFPQTAALLIAARANLEARNKNGETPLFQAIQESDESPTYACHKNSRVWATTQLLIDNGASLIVQNLFGNSLLEQVEKKISKGYMRTAEDGTAGKEILARIKKAYKANTACVVS